MADPGRVDRYRKGDRVFAKIKGYPPWPAQVEGRSSGKEEKYFLHFYATHDSAHVKPQMIFPYTPENILKFGKPTKPSPSFRRAMEEMESNLELYANIPSGQIEEPLPDDIEEGELQIDETPPPVLKREGKIPPTKKEKETKEVRPAPVVVPPAPKPPRRISKATKRDSLSTPGAVPIPVVETPPPALPVPQPEIVSRSGRKIKPKRFADDEIGSPVSILAKAALQSSFEEKQLQEAASAAATSTPSTSSNNKRSKKQKGNGPASPAPTLLPEAQAKANKEKENSEQPPEQAKTKGKVKTLPAKVPTSEVPPLVAIPTRNNRVPPPAAVQRAISPDVVSALEIDTGVSRVAPKMSRTDDEEALMEDMLEEDTREDAEDKENSAGNWVNTGPEEDTGSEVSNSSKTEKQFTEIPVSPDDSSVESVKVTLAVKKDTEVEILYNHDRPKQFETKEARIEWDVATAKNALKIRQTLESVEPAAIELFNLLVTAIEEKEGYIADAEEKILSEKRTNKLRKLRVEGEVIEIIGDVINCLSSRAADCDRAIDLLDRLHNHSLDALVLKKHPEIVETVRKLRMYEGNADEWDLTQEETDEFDEKATMIREKACKIYESYKLIFGASSDRPFEKLFSEELQKFQDHCNGLSHKDYLHLTEEPVFVMPAAVPEENGKDHLLDEDVDMADTRSQDNGIELAEEEQSRNAYNNFSEEGEIDESTVDEDTRENDLEGDSEELTIDDRTNNSTSNSNIDDSNDVTV